MGKRHAGCVCLILLFFGSFLLGAFNGEVATDPDGDQLLSETSLDLKNGASEIPQIVSQKNFTYAGNNQTETLLSFKGASLLNSDINTDIEIVTHDWNVSDVLINFTHIRIEELIAVEEETPPDDFVTLYDGGSGGNMDFYAMEFDVPEACFIFSLKVYVRYQGNFSVQAYILNSYQSLLNDPIPTSFSTPPAATSEVSDVITYGTENRTEWLELQFNPRSANSFVDTDNAYQKAFFVVLVPIPTNGNVGDAYFQWGYESDSVDDGNAYQYSDLISGWILTTIDLLLTNISFSRVEWTDSFDVESDYEDFIMVWNRDVMGGGEDDYRENAQAFQTTSNAYLKELEVYLRLQGAVTIYAEIFNATISSISNPGKAIPDVLLFSSRTIDLSAGLGYDEDWITLKFPNNETADSSFLDLSKTFNNTFFVVVQAEPGGVRGSVEWGFAYDSTNGDAGPAYFWDESFPPEFWKLQEDEGDTGGPIDLSLRNLQLFTYEKNPEDVTLLVNGSPVLDYGYINFGGSIFLPGPFNGEGGLLQLDTTAGDNIYYIALWTCTFLNQTYSFTSFLGRSIESVINWNVTNYISFPSWNLTRYGLGLYYTKQINITFPIDHNITQVTPLVPYTVNSSGDKKYLILNAQIKPKSSWLIRAKSPNYIQEIKTYNGTSEVLWYYYQENMNVTARLKDVINVYTQLKIYNRTENIVNSSAVIPDQNSIAKFPLWPINDNGTHYAVVYWCNGTEVGIKHVERMCVFRTNLSQVYSNIVDGSPFDPSDPIRVDVFYNDTDNAAGIPGATIVLNTTAAYSATQDIGKPGIYNITILPESLENGNYTLRILASRSGYDSADTFIHFRILRNATAFLNITGGCRNIIAGTVGWVDPDPYFDDQTHFVTVYYSNETGHGIKYAQVIAYPNWTSATWFGGPTNVTAGYYDMQIDTDGLHEGDTGKVILTAYSELYETKTVTVFINIAEIPSSLLLIDAGEYDNITAYEGETIEVAVGYWDSFHGNPILFNDPEEGNLSWEIAGTSAQGLLEKSVWQYENDISLPIWGILGNQTYDIIITAVAARDFAIKTTNLTLNVLEKEATTLVLSNSTATEYRIGQSFNLHANLSYYNGTPLVGETVDLNITHWLNNEYQFSIPYSLVTNDDGWATYEYVRIPAGIDEIRVNGTYMGTEKISPGEDFQIIPIKPKYNVTLLLWNTTTTDYRVGHDMTLYAQLILENGTLLEDYTVIFNLTYFMGLTEKQNIIVSRLTDESGIVFYEIEEIPDEVDSLVFIASFRSTLTMNGNITGRIIPIAPKYQVVLNITSTLPSQVMVGDALEFTLSLKNNITQMGISNESVWVILHFDPETSISQKFVTDSQGIAAIQMIIPSDLGSYDSFTIELWYAGTGKTQQANILVGTEIAVMTWGKIILKWLPYIVAAVAIAVGSYVAYQRAVIAPRRRRRLARMEKLAAKFSDIVNLQHLLVIHSKSGSCLYQQVLGDTTLDADLISGFLTAISAFQTEIQAPKTPKAPFTEQKAVSEEKKKIDQGFELSYANFKILLKDGNKTRTAVILATTPTESLRESLNEFVRQFETKYEHDLKDWKGAVAVFQTAGAVVEDSFETSLLWPHIVERASDEVMKQLNALESSLVTLASSIQQEKKYFFIPSLVEMIEKVRRDSHVEVLGTIDELRQKKIFRAVPIDVLQGMIQGENNTST